MGGGLQEHVSEEQQRVRGDVIDGDDSGRTARGRLEGGRAQVQRAARLRARARVCTHAPTR